MINKLKNYEELLRLYIQKDDIPNLYRLRNKLYYLENGLRKDLSIIESKLKDNMLINITEYISKKRR